MWSSATSLLDTADFWALAEMLVVGAALLVGAHLLFRRWERRGLTTRFTRQLVLLALTMLLIVGVVMTLPVQEADDRRALLGLIGIVASAAIALSSTTLLGNVLAGFMVRSVRRLQVGDFVHIGEHFGRITERGLLFTEVQTEHSDLVEFPNLHLAQNPVKLLREHGTIVSAEVSLGYDVAREQVREALLRAAETAELSDAFVLVVELGDFSIVYRVGGLLTDVKSVISANSRLRSSMLDELHAEGIEIVSPNFMNTRALQASQRFVPRPARRGAQPAAEDGQDVGVEAIAFGEAERAEVVEALRGRLRELEEQRKQRAAELKAAKDEAADELKQRIAVLDNRIERLQAMLSARETAKQA